MDNVVIEIVIFALLVFFAGFLEAAKIAISSIGENKIDELKEQKNKTVLFFEKILQDEESFFGSIQLLFTLTTVLSAIVGFRLTLNFLNSLLPAQGYSNSIINTNLLAVILAVIIITSIIIIFSLLIPKAIGFKYSNGLSIKSARLLYGFSQVLKIPVKLLTAVSNWFLKPIKEKTYFSLSRPSEDEILDIISDGVKSGAIDKAELEIIENILEFNDLKADEVMIPRIDMVAVDMNEDTEVTLKEIMKTGHSLIPAYEENPDNIIGVIHTKELMRLYIDKKQISLKNLVRPAYFIPGTKPISEVLKEMQQIGERLAIVTDEYGGTEGLITLEDVLEEIVGEIKDRTKNEISEFSKFPDGTFCILGSMDIDDFNDTFNYKLKESEEYNTVAGFIAEKSGKILNQGESFEYEGLHFELIKKIKQKMVQFRVFTEDNKFKDYSFCVGLAGFNDENSAIGTDAAVHLINNWQKESENRLRLEGNGDILL
ncbi:MAG: HlyC/CorC family transporter, partial [Bacteroidetes bacterium]|nr:HlyC/CorC family transporter [Bacteroidota bacterium]